MVGMMNAGLFGAAGALEHLSIPDADVSLIRDLDLGLPGDVIVRRIVEETPWRSETILMWGKEFVSPRLVAWYGDEGTTYVYSGIRHHPLAWTPLLADLRRRVEEAAQEHFDSVLVNYYRGERDSVAMHSDDEKELGREPVIASLSIGETRTFVMRHKTDRSQKIRRLVLESGSLLLMKGPTQRCWQHGVPKEKSPCGPRVNLTFRQRLTGSRRTTGNA
jgi:alkylated DNA repair dioxygenase AlkB